MLNKRVDAHTRVVCLSHVQKVVEDLFDIRLEKAELEQTVAGTLPMLPGLQRRRLTAFQNTHANNQDMLGIAHVVLHALQTRAAIKEGRSLDVAHLHHTGTELQFGKNAQRFHACPEKCFSQITTEAGVETVIRYTNTPHVCPRTQM